MRVIERGKHPNEKKMRGRCQGCHTLIECTYGECKTDPDPRENGDPYVHCPVCNRFIWVKPYTEGDREEGAK